MSFSTGLKAEVRGTSEVRINLLCFYSDLANFPGSRTPESSFAVGLGTTKCFKC